MSLTTLLLNNAYLSFTLRLKFYFLPHISVTCLTYIGSLRILDFTHASSTTYQDLINEGLQLTCVTVFKDFLHRLCTST